MTSNIALFSVLFLAVIVAIAFWRKCNIGILAIGGAFILGTLSGISGKEILAGFDASLFLNLCGVSFLFSLAQVNGTLEYICKKAIGLAGKRTYLVPILLFLVTGILCAIGPGNIPSGNLMTVVAVTLAVEMGANPLLFALAAKVAANGFTLSPITPAGILMDKLCTDAGYSASDFAIPSMVNLILWSCLLMVIFCIYYKVWKIKPALQTSASSTAVTQKMSKEQVITALGIVVMVIMVVGFSISVGLASFAVAAVLMALKTSDEKKALAKVPWGTLLLITGMGVLMNVVLKAGGIHMISAALLKVMSPITAAPIMSLTASILSFFSSTTGVVMPTLIPTLDGIVTSLGTGTAGFVELAGVVVSGAMSAAFSPASTGGGLIMAAYMTASNSENKEEEQNKLFGTLFVIALACVALNVLFSFLGVYKLGYALFG